MTRTSDHLIADRQRVARVTTWVSIGVNVLLTAMQLAIGLFARSQALVADAIHTLSDVVSDIVVLIANRHCITCCSLSQPLQRAGDVRHDLV